MILYTIKLLQSEVDTLKSILAKGKHSSQAFRAASILLNCDKGEFAQNKDVTIEQISSILGINERTITRVKKRFLEEGLDSVLERKPSSQSYIKKIDGDLEAKIVAVACTETPEGFSKWSLRMLADKVVELEYIDSISHVSIGNTLKKTNLNPGK